MVFVASNRRRRIIRFHFSVMAPRRWSRVGGLLIRLATGRVRYASDCLGFLFPLFFLAVVLVEQPLAQPD